MTAAWLDRIRQSLGMVAAEPASALPVRTGMPGRVMGPSMPVRLLGFDQALVFVTMALLLWGLVMVYSASVAMPDNPRLARLTSSHHLLRHTFALGVGLVAAVLAFQVPLDTWERFAPWLFVASLILLVVVLIPGIGNVVNGARRWISLGFMSFQP